MGGKSEAPEIPDYIGQAQAQSLGNLNLARAGASANRINQTTPYGSISYTQGEGFDQDKYDRFLAQQADINRGDGQEANRVQYYKTLGTYIDPNDSFLKNPDKWSSTITLAPEEQRALDARRYQNNALDGMAYRTLDQVGNALRDPLNTSDLPGMIYDIGDGSTGDTWSKYSGLLMDRLNPDLDKQQAALDTRLANMGVTAGSEGWDTQQRQFAKQRNDAGVAAQIAGADLAMRGAELNNKGRQQSINERADLRSLPLKELQQLRSMTATTNPTFSQPGAQQLTAGADLLGSSQASYNAALGQVNAENAQAASNTQAGVGAAALAAMYFY